MRIAFFCDSFKPYLSGVTNSVDLLSKDLRNLGHKVFIFAPHYPGHVDYDPDIIRFPSLPTGYPNFRLALPYLNRVPEVDLIHTHSPFQAGLLARYLANKRKLPLVYTFHTLFTRYVHYARFLPEPLSKLSLITYARAFCRRCDLIITPSEMARRVLRSWKINCQTAVVPTGVDFEQFRNIKSYSRRELRKLYGIGEKAKVLIYIGRLSKEKNIQFLLNAFKKIRENFSDTYLVLAGGGPIEKELIAKKIKNVVLTGEVSYPEVLSYYSIGDIFVFASLTETQGLVLAEAKAAGLPVVALFAGGLAGTVRSGKDGYLTARNKDVFIEQVEKLLKNDELRYWMGTAARADARHRFSSKITAKKIDSLYHETLESFPLRREASRR